MVQIKSGITDCEYGDHARQLYTAETISTEQAGKFQRMDSAADRPKL